MLWNGASLFNTLKQANYFFYVRTVCFSFLRRSPFQVEMDEVIIVGEVSNKEMVEGVEEKKEKKGAGRDGDHWGSMDRRTTEVKAEVNTRKKLIIV